MRTLDRWAIEERGVPGLTLMEQAGAGLAAVIEQTAPDGLVVIVCGAGNNGGDGYVAARMLRERGRPVRVLTTVDPARLGGDAAANRDALPGDAPEPFTAEALAGAAVIADAILGTGATGAPREEVAAAIEAINAAPAAVVAADVPSGVDAGSGEIAGVAIRATATATFAARKTGLYIAPAKQHAGAVTVVELGFPAGWPVAPSATLLGTDAAAIVPARAAAANKFTSGHVLVAGGSRGLSGAPCLAASAATRAGAGYVTALVPAALVDIVETRHAEVLTALLPGAADHHDPPNVAPIVGRCQERGGALVLGPGLGRNEQTATFARELAASAPVALVLDADGLNAYSGRLEQLAARSQPTVLTPHAGELARLLGGEQGKSVGENRLASARMAADRSGAVVVLKGDDTIIAEPGSGGRVAISPGDAPALATAGTGDVLSGITGALLAKGIEPFAATCAAVALHSEAGRAAARRLRGPDGVIATDIVDALPRVLGRAVAAAGEGGER